jgi:hypothetical protein
VVLKRPRETVCAILPKYPDSRDRLLQGGNLLLVTGRRRKVWEALPPPNGVPRFSHVSFERELEELKKMLLLIGSGIFCIVLLALDLLTAPKYQDDKR